MADFEELRSWRRAERARLLAARLQIPSRTLDAWRASIDRRLSELLAVRLRGESVGVLAFCWPIRNEYDARHLAGTLRERGALTALPVVVATGQPLAFREWHPGVLLETGPMGIPFPVGSKELVPDTLLLPFLGWDDEGYRLGYGAGYFDRTLAAMRPRPFSVGVGYELSRIESVRPQEWDVPMDAIVTEERLLRFDRQA